MRGCWMDRRERVVDAVAGGLPQAVAGRTFGVGRATVRRWVDRRRAGELRPAPVGGAAPRIGPGDAAALRAQGAAAPDATLAEHARPWGRGPGGGGSPRAGHPARHP